MITHYDRLQVSRNASQEQIKIAYRHLASKFHPDKFKYPKDKKFAEDMMKEINVAYDVLSDLSKKNSYDEWLSDQPDENQNKTSSDISNSGNNTNFNNSDFQSEIEMSDGQNQAVALWCVCIAGVGAAPLFINGSKLSLINIIFCLTMIFTAYKLNELNKVAYWVSLIVSVGIVGALFKAVGYGALPAFLGCCVIYGLWDLKKFFD